MKKNTAVLTFVLSLGVLLAQPGPPTAGPHWGMPRLDALKSFLQLSDKQVQDFTALLSSFRDTVKPIHEQIMAKQKQREQEMAKASADPSVVAQLMVDVKDLRTQIKSKRDELQPQMLAILSDSQRGQLAALQQALSLQQAARQAAALGLIEAPQNNTSEDTGFGEGWRGRHAMQPGRP